MLCFCEIIPSKRGRPKRALKIMCPKKAVYTKITASRASHILTHECNMSFCMVYHIISSGVRQHCGTWSVCRILPHCAKEMLRCRITSSGWNGILQSNENWTRRTDTKFRGSCILISVYSTCSNEWLPAQLYLRSKRRRHCGKHRWFFPLYVQGKFQQT